MSGYLANSHTECDWDDPERDAYVAEQLVTFRPCQEPGCDEQLNATQATCPAGHFQRGNGGALAGPDEEEWTRGPGGGGRGTPSGPSEKQLAFIATLAAERKLDVAAPKTKAQASKLIDDLLAMPKAATATTTETPSTNRRANRYGGKCVRCGGWVEAEAGYLAKTTAGKWAAEHIGECPAAPKATATAEAEEAPEGMHRLADGTIYKVQIAHHGSGRPYAKRLVVHGAGEATFEYAQGAVRQLSTATLMTLEEAKEFGALYGVCCRCAATLTDEGSIAAGIGPVCASKGWG
jgi:hypothetical protein